MTKHPCRRATGVVGLFFLAIALGLVSCHARLRNRDARIDAILRTSSDCEQLTATVFIAYETGYVGLSGDDAAMHIAKQLEQNPFIVAVECHGDSDFAMQCQTQAMPAWYFFGHRNTLAATLWPFHDYP